MKLESEAQPTCTSKMPIILLNSKEIIIKKKSLLVFICGFESRGCLNLLNMDQGNSEIWMMETAPEKSSPEHKTMQHIMQESLLQIQCLGSSREPSEVLQRSDAKLWCYICSYICSHISP